jgi:PTS system nitrogen regulatory IIA component
MEMTARDVALLIGRSETTVRRLARLGVLPAYLIDDAYHFNAVEIQQWALEHEVKIDPALLRQPGCDSSPPPSVHSALVRGGVYYKVPGQTPEEVFRHVIQLPGIPEGTDRGLLHHLLVVREALGSTGIGDGIAIPHPRSPLVLGVREPVILLCFLEHCVDFHAIDGQPVRAILTLLCPTLRTHLRLLASVTHLVNHEAVRGLLRSYSSREIILGRIRALEETSNTSRNGYGNGSLPAE